jgi:hypothetical protein
MTLAPPTQQRAAGPGRVLASSRPRASQPLVAHRASHDFAAVRVHGPTVIRRQPAETPAASATPSAGPRFSDECSSFQRCSVIEPLVHAKRLADTAIAALGPVASGSVTSGRIVDLVNVHFHDPGNPAGAASFALDKFRLIGSELAAPIRYVCRADQPADCEVTGTGFVGGFTNCAPGADVELCSPYYVSLDCEEQARVLVHEVAHHVPELCPDRAYVGEPGYMALSAEHARTNPDTYAQFATMAFTGAASCVDCGFEVQREGGRRY